MCGIAGLYAQNGFNEDPLPELRRTTAALVHRGPDDQGFHHLEGEPVALGHRRLSIIDLHTGHQPIDNEDGSVSVVFNGEVYNFQSLREHLLDRGHTFATNTDTEAIVHLYEDVGLECFSRLRGMFALALWDRSRQRLVLARDPLGKKPLYYHFANGCLRFASELAALATSPAVPREIDFQALDLFFELSYIPHPFSIYRGVRKLPPGHYLVADRSGVRVEPYWSPGYTPKSDLDYREAQAAILETLTEAVRLRMISDVPLGCFLSGGVDSSIVAVLMSELSSEPVKTFSIGFEDQDISELGHAREIATMLGTDHNEFVVKPLHADLLPRLTRQYGEPFGDCSALPTWYLAEMTRTHVTVALNGDGGDELFAGYQHHQRSLLVNRLAGLLPGPLRRVAGSLATIDDDDIKGLPGSKAGRLLHLMRLAPAERNAHYRRWMGERMRERLRGPVFREALGQLPGNGISRLPEDLFLAQEEAGLLDRILYTDARSYLPGSILVKADIACMAHSLEARSPLLDSRLWDLVTRLPSHYKLHRGRGKRILKDLMEDRFPPGFLDRPKQGFDIPLDRWFRGAMKEEARRTVLDGAPCRNGIIDPAFAERLLDEHAAGFHNHAMNIWNLLIFSIWHDEFL